jgi:HTH-type transcriptional regulator/antitoxin HigA
VTTPAKSPGEYIRAELDSRGWTQAELARIVDRPIQAINEIVQGKKSITPETAAALGAAFGTGPEVWLKREAEYRLSQSDVDTSDITRRARLYELAPIKELEKRQWIRPTKTTDELEVELKQFFGVDSLDVAPAIGAATRRSDGQDELSPSQRAWCFRVRQLAQSLLVGQYDEANLPACEKELRKLAAYPAETHKLCKVLGKYGIRLVIVEPLSGCKVDGVALWLDRDSPVIGLSLRYDRFDAFWFTLCHELMHIRYRDECPVDSDVSGNMMLPTDMKPAMERRADDEAAHLLIPREELGSFIRRVGPLYSKERIVQFAHRIKIHPGIIVGQLQHRGEVGYHANREMLSKVRQLVAPAAITDGWGHSIDPRNIR